MFPVSAMHFGVQALFLFKPQMQGELSKLQWPKITGVLKSCISG